MLINDELEEDRKLARRLPVVWPAFFQHFGRLTEVQRKSMGSILDGNHTLICAATASGKTEAACAPLFERMKGMSGSWTILYLSPTRALVNDLFHRLEGPSLQLGLRIARRTSEHRSENEDTQLLLTTPESLDSMLCRGIASDGSTHILSHVSAVVLDEIHLLHGTPRGEQTKWLLERLRRLRLYAQNQGWTRSNKLQIIGLSATVARPNDVIETFMPGGKLIYIPGKREIIEVQPVTSQFMPVERALPMYLQSLSHPEKWIVFCKSRKRVDELTEVFRKSMSPHGYSVGAHHGSLGKVLRETTERDIRRLERYIVVATSTLEIGIDIGDVDGVALDGPPDNMAAFLQRIGRGNRRSTQTRVMACSQSVKEANLQNAMMDAACVGWFPDEPVGSLSSVILQQTLSYVFQGKGQRSRSLVQKLFENNYTTQEISDILDQSISNEDLIETPVGLRLSDEWHDRAARGEIHSVIESFSGQTAYDSITGVKLANQVRYLSGKGLSVGGRHYQIVSQNSYRLNLKLSSRLPEGINQWAYVSGPFNARTEHPMLLRHWLKLAAEEWPVITDGYRFYAFHLGGIRLSSCMSLLSGYLPVNQRPFEITPYYIALREEVIPYWLSACTVHAIRAGVDSQIKKIERQLGLPLANKRLPLKIRVRDVIGWIQPEEVVHTIQQATLLRDDEVGKVLSLFIINKEY
ncbi:DEAD/DEAH box helicase [Paenibacillus roseipurpureus]|uniref:DEAD/DEAH box helicase n=1 Tax=Paenibacillus roseopurpureus TaxID=2918901 RepID=A0AA96LNB3_9BACL|nr:DEAD/DEAH box helicase [Paenibacillus sp. MBLB1832]WNR45152.1 DEAD/DEAH box helicase [Paenibacillus sp. MBLB1832]